MKIPKTAGEVVDFIGNNFQSVTVDDGCGNYYKLDEIIFTLSIRDLLLAFDKDWAAKNPKQK